MRGLIVLLVLAPFAFSQQAKHSGDAKPFLEIEQELLKADETMDTSALQKYLAKDYIVKSIDGRTYDKAATIQSAKAGPPTKETMQGAKAAVLGQYALVTYTLVANNLDGKMFRAEVGDLFRKESDGWKLAARVGTPHAE